MYKTVVWIVLVYVGAYLSSEVYHQERAVVTNINPKYVRNVSAYTGRQKRGAPYKTNITGTTLHSWGDNVTVDISVTSQQKYSQSQTIKLKICNAFRLKWVVEYVTKYSDITSACPVPVGTYAAINLELPPKNFPLPFPKGNYRLNIHFSMTATREAIMDINALVAVV